MLKKLALVAIALSLVGLVRLSQRTPLSELENLRRLDTIDANAPALVVTTRDAFQSINENALGYLPVMPVLHVEDAIAGVALSVSNSSATTVAHNESSWFSPFGFFGNIALQ